MLYCCQVLTVRTLCDAQYVCQSRTYLCRGIKRTFDSYFSRVSPLDVPLAMNKDKGFTHYAGIILSIIVRQKNRELCRNNSDKNWLTVGGFGPPSEIWALVLWLCSTHSTCQKVLLIQHSFAVSEVIHYCRKLISQ